MNKINPKEIRIPPESIKSNKDKGMELFHKWFSSLWN